MTVTPAPSTPPNLSSTITSDQRYWANPFIKKPTVGLPANQKPLLETECQYIRTGNNAGLHAIDKQICKLQAAAQPVTERATMLAQCKNL